MRVRLVLGLAALGLLLAAVAAGCGGNDGGSKNPRDEEAERLLEAMILTPEDLPPGLQEGAAVFSTNEELVEAKPDPEEELSRLQTLGRRLGYDVTLVPLPAAPEDLPIRGVQVTASLYETSEGASDSFTEAIAMAADTDWEALNPELNDLEVVEMDAVADIGDGTFWVRVSGVAPQGGLLVDDQVAIRVGSVRAFLRVVAIFPGETDRSIYSDEVERWARLLSDRIIDALANGMGP